MVVLELNDEAVDGRLLQDGAAALKLEQKNRLAELDAAAVEAVKTLRQAEAEHEKAKLALAQLAEVVAEEEWGEESEEYIDLIREDFERIEKYAPLVERLSAWLKEHPWPNFDKLEEGEGKRPQRQRVEDRDAPIRDPPCVARLSPEAAGGQRFQPCEEGEEGQEYDQTDGGFVLHGPDTRAWRGWCKSGLTPHG